MSVTNAVLRGRSFGTCLCACDEGPAILQEPLSLQEGSQGRGHHAESRAEFPLGACRMLGSCIRQRAWTAEVAEPVGGLEGQDVQTGPGALPLDFLALPHLRGQRCVPWALQRPRSPAPSPVPSSALKPKGAHWLLAQTPILWNSIHAPCHLEGISHFEWINFIWLLPSTTMLLIHAPLQPVRWGQVHWAALSQTYLLVSHPLGITSPSLCWLQMNTSCSFYLEQLFIFFFKCYCCTTHWQTSRQGRAWFLGTAKAFPTICQFKRQPERELVQSVPVE